MNIPRNFLLLGVIWILIGMSIGHYLAATHDLTYMPLHAHINLLGFVLPAIFALIYRSWPEMAASPLAAWHFWLHTLSTLVLMVMLYLFFSGAMSEDSAIGSAVAGIAATAVMAGIALLGLNLLRNAR